MGACYLLQFPNGKVYVGITTKTATDRFVAHCRAHTQSQWGHYPLYRALRKYGPESVIVHVLTESEDWATLCAYERTFIALFGSQHRALGYNCTSGGDGMPDLSEEARERHADAQRKRWVSPVLREKMAAAAGDALRKRWADDPEYREKMAAVYADAGRGQKTRSLAALVDSVPDYGEFTAIGVPDPTDFVDRVRVAVLRSPMGGHQLARVSGVRQPTIHRFTTRENHPRPATLHRLAVALGVTDDQQ